MDSIISSLVTNFAPVQDINIRLQLGLFSGQLYRIASEGKYSSWFSRYWQKTTNVLTIQQRNEEGKIDPIFEQMEEYIVRKHAEKCRELNLIPKKGDMVFSLRSNQQISIQETFHGQTLEIKICHNSSDEKNSSRYLNIRITSQSLTIHDLKQYVSQICKLEKKMHNTITVYRPTIHSSTTGKSEFAHVEWDKIYMKTNKTLGNTIYPLKVQKELFDDVEWFMNNEEWFKRRGVPYKRGYLIHGKAGHGKTSVAKILSSKYNLPIFIIDMQSISNNSDFIKMTTEINYLTDGRYIISIEDIDRTPMFCNHWYNNSGDKLSLECFMNFLDGIVETHGRIVLFTANDMEVMENTLKQNNKHVAVFRPGRIDVTIEIPDCDAYQASKLFELFYESSMEENKIVLPPNISPALLINLFSKYSHQESVEFLTRAGKIDEVLQHLGLKNSSSSPDVVNRRKQYVKRKKDPVKELQKKRKLVERLEREMVRFTQQTQCLKHQLVNDEEKVSALQEIRKSKKRKAVVLKPGSKLTKAKQAKHTKTKTVCFDPPPILMDKGVQKESPALRRSARIKNKANTTS